MLLVDPKPGDCGRALLLFACAMAMVAVLALVAQLRRPGTPIPRLDAAVASIRELAYEPSRVGPLPTVGRCKARLGEVLSAVLEYRRRNDRWPRTDPVGLSEDLNGILKEWTTSGQLPAGADNILDPWNRPVTMREDPDATMGVMLYSFGPDGLDQQGQGDDVVLR